MKTNVIVSNSKYLSSIPKTHEGTPTKRIDYKAQLKRSVMACLLWENTFYESGVDIAERIVSLVPKVKPKDVASIAVEARKEMNLRHAPLWIICAMLKASPQHKQLVGSIIPEIATRADQLPELLALYWKNGKTPLANQLKKGLAKAFQRFDTYQLAKYNRDESIKLRDVLFLTHPTPKDKKQEEDWKKLVNSTLPSPDTWEVILSTAKEKGLSKKEAWEKIIDIWITEEKVMNHFAILRNLRNIKEAGVSKKHLSKIEGCFDNPSWAKSKILPFRFIAAAKEVPHLEPELEAAMFHSLSGMSRLPGHTVLLVDVSGSMNNKLSSKSTITRMEAAAGLAMILRETCQKVSVYCFSYETKKIAPRRGFALTEGIVNSMKHGSTYTGKALRTINQKEDYDRIILITDEQSHDAIPNPKTRGYCVNVAAYRNGIGYGKWIHVDGWSDSIVRFIVATELGIQGEITEEE